MTRRPALGLPLATAVQSPRDFPFVALEFIPALPGPEQASRAVTLTKVSCEAHATSESYEGSMIRERLVRTACECREDEINGLTAE